MTKLVLVSLGLSLVAGCGTSAPFSLKSRGYSTPQGVVCPAPQQVICTGRSASRIKSRAPDKFEGCSCGFLRDIS